MRILICDDDTLILEHIYKLLKHYFESAHLKMPEIISYSNGESLLMDKGSKDIVFLDIEMPGMNGIYVGNELKSQNRNVIIFVVTSYSEYLDEAMSFRVFRYLSKPLDKARLYRNLEAAMKIYMASDRKVVVETKAGVYSVVAEKIVMVEAVNRKVILYTLKREFECVQPIKYWTEQLTDKCFFNRIGALL